VLEFLPFLIFQPGPPDHPLEVSLHDSVYAFVVVLEGRGPLNQHFFGDLLSAEVASQTLLDERRRFGSPLIDSFPEAPPEYEALDHPLNQDHCFHELPQLEHLVDAAFLEAVPLLDFTSSVYSLRCLGPLVESPLHVQHRKSEGRLQGVHFE